MAPARRSSSLSGAFIGSVFFFIIVLGLAEFGIAWIYLENEGYYDPGFVDLLEAVAGPLRNIDPDFAYADPLTLVFGQLLLSALALSFYFLPTINARRRDHGLKVPVFVVNLLFGLTGIGWLGALIWSSLGGSSAVAVQKEGADESWREHLKVQHQAARKTSGSARHHQAPLQKDSLETALADRQPAVVSRNRGPTIQRR